MAEADIAYMIQRIYEKYNATQKDKKYEERVYMREDEFRANLEEMVKKSPIEDKVLLYKEIYRSISENALEIDSKGEITISPKLIIAVEKEIKLRQEQEDRLSDDVDRVDNSLENDFNEIMSISEYSQLSDEEKMDKFFDAAGWMFSSKEEADSAYRGLNAITVNMDVDPQEMINALDSGEEIDSKAYTAVTGENSVDDKEFKKFGLQLASFLQYVVKNESCAGLFIKDENGKMILNMPLITKMANSLNKTDVNEITFNQILEKYIEEQQETNQTVMTAEEKEGLQNLFKNKDAFEFVIKSLQIVGNIYGDRVDISKEDDLQIQSGQIEMFKKHFLNPNFEKTLNAVREQFRC